MTNRVVLLARQATLAGGINSLEWIPGLIRSLKIRAQAPNGNGIIFRNWKKSRNSNRGRTGNSTRNRNTTIKENSTKDRVMTEPATRNFAG